MKAISILLFAFACLNSVIPANAQQRPNLIYIMADDMGYADLSCYGRKDYKTPVLDDFAKQGMQFSQAYAAAPVCTPTRVAFLTGKFPTRNPIGVREPLLMDSTDINIGLSSEPATVAMHLKKSGYSTALFGKWHLGFRPEYFPGAHGFDYFFGISPGAADYVNHKYAGGKDVLFENNEPVQKEGYLTDLLTDRAIDFIKRSDSRPFFISMQYTAPHWPWQAPGDPPYAAGVGFAQGGSLEIYAKMMQSLDTNIGRLLDALKKSGKENNTLVIFTSDNGGEKFSDMGPFRGKKFELWEGGIRVPAMVRWPGKIKPGSRTEQVAVTMDWTATLLDAAGISWKDKAYDGISLVPHITGGPVQPRELYWRVSNRTPFRAFRSGDWKYLKMKDSEFLFNLKDDKEEKNDVKDKEPAIFEKLKHTWESLEKEMHKPFIIPR